MGKRVLYLSQGSSLRLGVAGYRIIIWKNRYSSLSVMVEMVECQINQDHGIFGQRWNTRIEKQQTSTSKRLKSRIMRSRRTQLPQNMKYLDPISLRREFHHVGMWFG
jgi:hypothetical protein